MPPLFAGKKSARQTATTRHSPPRPLHGIYPTNSQTKVVLVSDFLLAKELFKPELDGFLVRWRAANPPFLVADINTHVGEVPSLQELPEAR